MLRSLVGSEMCIRDRARIVAFEGNQEFLDSLHRYPKDFPFNIRFGGNIHPWRRKVPENKTLCLLLLLPRKQKLTILTLLLPILTTLTLQIPILTPLFSTIPSRCNPDDPHAAKGYRPRVNRAAVQKLLGGATTEVLNSANQAEDELSAQMASTNVSGSSDTCIICLLYTSPSPRDS